MPKFKIIFEVRDEEKLVIEKQQIWVEVDDAALASPKLSDAYNAAIVAMESGSDHESQKIVLSDSKRFSEAFQAAGSIIARFIEIKIKEAHEQEVTK
jgi:hypothetical protein